MRESGRGAVRGSMLLLNETALVTGAGGPSGRAISEAIAREGGGLLLTDNDERSGQLTHDAILAQGGQSFFLPADLTGAEASQRAFDCALAKLGKISIFVHCANPNHFGASVSTVTEEAWLSTLSVNVLAAARLGRLLGQHMREHAINGRMLFVTSLHAQTPSLVPHYSAAKAALEMLMKEFAIALGPFGIRVNAIAPGMIAPERLPVHEPFMRATAMRRIGSPEELANTAIAVLSDRFGSFVAGTTITVD